jgi:hypothetical protein
MRWLLLLTVVEVGCALPYPWARISGTFLDVAYDRRMHYTNKVSRDFTCLQWISKIREYVHSEFDSVVDPVIIDGRLQIMRGCFSSEAYV